MKKIILFIMFLLLAIAAQGCSLLVIEENTFEYRELSDQYNQYVMNDIINFEDFREVMNNASNVSSTSVFMIKTDILDVFNRVSKTYHGSGTHIFKDNNYSYILTTFQIIDLTSKRVNYFVTDAYGEKMSAEIFAADSTLGLGILRVANAVNDYDIVKYASYMPLSNELVLMIAHSYPTQNIQKLGFYLYQDETSYMEVSSTSNANGAPIFNLKLEVIGIQYLYGESYIEIIDYETIYEFISPLLPI